MYSGSSPPSSLTESVSLSFDCWLPSRVSQSIKTFSPGSKTMNLLKGIHIGIHKKKLNMEVLLCEFCHRKSI